MKVYPSPIASMEEALNVLLCEPYGCFEQTSSIAYPLMKGLNRKKLQKQLLKQGYHGLQGMSREAMATRGSHSIALKMTGRGNKMPFALEIVYNTPLPKPVEMEVSLQATNKDVSTPVALIGISA